MGKLFGVIFFFITVSVQTFASIDYSDAKKQPIRLSYHHVCESFLCLPEKVGDKNVLNDSVGIPLGGVDAELFRTQMLKVINSRPEALNGAVVYVAGVDLQHEKQTKAEYENVLVDLGLTPEQVKIKILSIPKLEVEKGVQHTLKYVFQKMVYWFPSIKRDFQKPDRNEVISGLISTSIVETGNITYLMTSLPTPDAYLTVTVHLITKLSMTIFQKFTFNWMLRPGSSKFELFSKQLFFSLPFIINYNVFGNWTAISKYVSTHGMVAAVERFPTELASFGTTQGLTILLQTFFYAVVNTKVIGGWEMRQHGTQNSNNARVVRNIARIPSSFMNAIALAIAGGVGASTVASIGPLQLNNGHLYLLGMTVGGVIFYKLSLDPMLSLYNKADGFIAGKVKAIKVNPDLVRSPLCASVFL